MQLAPITTITQLRTDARALAVAANDLDRALRVQLPPGATVTGSVAQGIDDVIAAASVMFDRADAAATTAVTWEGDTHLGVAALQLREGVEEHYDIADEAIGVLRDVVAAGAIPDVHGVVRQVRELRRAAMTLRGFGTDMVQTIDARSGAQFTRA